MALLVILGSGTPTPSHVRWGSSFLLEVCGELMMFDCGPATTYKLYKAGFEATQVSKLFFTHHHSDHDADYPTFLLTRFDMSVGQENELEVFGPTLTEQLTYRLLGEDIGAYWHDIVARTSHPLSLWAHQNRGGELPRKPPVIHAQDIGPGKITSGKHWEVTATRVEHVQPYLDSLAYRVDTDDGSIVFSGDTKPCASLTKLSKDADVLVMECIRTHAEIAGTASEDSETDSIGAGTIASESGVKQLVLCHQGLTLEEPELKAKAMAEIKNNYSGPIIWGEELMKIPWGKGEKLLDLS